MEDIISQLAGLTELNKTVSPQHEGIWTHPETKIKHYSGKPFAAFPNTLGWAKKEKNQGLIEEFRSLTRASDKKVIQFARDWGPLWIEGKSIERRTKEGYYVEELQKYRNQAQAFQDVISWCAYLKVDKQPDEELVKRTPINIFNPKDLFSEQLKSKPIEIEQKDYYSSEDKEKIKKILVNRIQENIDQVKFETYWDEDGPELKINYGFGFLPVAWFQLAQVISGASGIYKCDGCKEFYIRTGKKAPARNRKNYCDSCSKDEHKVAKRLWARERKLGL